MYVYGVYFFLNLFNFTKYHQHILITINMLFNISVVYYSYRYLVHSFFIPNFTFKIFLYKLLFFVSNVNFNLTILYINASLLIVWVFGLRHIRFIITYIIITEINLYEQYSLINFFGKNININFINGLFLIHPIYLTILFIGVYVSVFYGKNNVYVNNIVNFRSVFFRKYTYISVIKKN